MLLLLKIVKENKVIMKENIINSNVDLPEFLVNLLKQQYSEEYFCKIVEGYKIHRKTTIRVNTIKTDAKKIKKELKQNGIKFKEVSWYQDALIIENAIEKDLQELDIYEKGEIYLQSLSSMLPPIILNPQKDEDILDMCAAPRWKNYPNCCINIKWCTYNCL